MKYLSLSFINNLTVKAVALFGALLATVQFLYNRSLWGDEAMLAINFIERDFSGLLDPLSYKQTAPILFLFTEELFSLIIPNSEYGLRIFPLICYLGSIYYFILIIKKIFNKEVLVVAAISLFVFNYFFIYYASEVKQYMVDVFFSNLFIYILINKKDYLFKNTWKLFLMGFLAILYSNIAPILLATTGICMLTDITAIRKNIKKILICAVSLFIVFAGYYVLFVSKIKSQEFLIYYWTYKEPAFMPLNPFSIEFWNFIYAKYIMLFHYLFRFGNVASMIFQLFFVLGIAQIFRKRDLYLFLIIFTPVILHLILSGFKIYPFHIRFCLYLIPGFILLIIKGVELVQEILLKKIGKFNFPFAIIPLLAFLLFLNFKISGFPLVKQEYKKTINYVSNKLQPQDKVFVFAESTVIYKCYLKTGKIKIPEKSVIYGDYFDKSSIYEQFNSLRSPVWLLITSVDQEDIDETQNFLIKNNFELKDEFLVSGATASYYVPKKITK